tara:strand:+ start:9092 stop:9343 length:252 start_codon:yes stop_codon:yes gene_type:complete
MSLINADKYIERLRQTLKDTKSIGVNKLSSTEKYEYLSNRCSDIIKDYDEEYNETLEELWDEQGRDKEEKEKAEDKTYEKENS